jgi:hypothetical protein
MRERKKMLLRKIMLAVACIGFCSVLLGADVEVLAVKAIEFPQLLSDGKPAVLDLSDEEPMSGKTFAQVITQRLATGKPFTVAAVPGQAVTTDASGEHRFYTDHGFYDDAALRVVYLDPKSLVSFNITSLDQPPVRVNREVIEFHKPWDFQDQPRLVLSNTEEFTKKTFSQLIHASLKAEKSYVIALHVSAKRVSNYWDAEALYKYAQEKNLKFSSESLMLYEVVDFDTPPKRLGISLDQLEAYINNSLRGLAGQTEESSAAAAAAPAGDSAVPGAVSAPRPAPTALVKVRMEVSVPMSEYVELARLYDSVKRENADTSHLNLADIDPASYRMVLGTGYYNLRLDESVDRGVVTQLLEDEFKQIVQDALMRHHPGILNVTHFEIIGGRMVTFFDKIEPFMNDVFDKMRIGSAYTRLRGVISSLGFISRQGPCVCVAQADTSAAERSYSLAEGSSPEFVLDSSGLTINRVS